MGSKNYHNTILTKDDIIKTYKKSDNGVKALSKYNKWFPVRASPKLAGIVADLMCDGHIQGAPLWRLDYCSKHREELLRFNREIYSLFKVRGKIRNCNTNKYGTKNLGINNKPLSRLLFSIGTPTGAKVLTKFPIPYWILENKVIFARFINRLFSCEGTIDMKGKSIDIGMSKALHLIDDGIKFFSTIQQYLTQYYKIKSTNPFLESRTNIRKDGVQTKAIKLKIRNKESVKIFKEKIGIEDKEKNKKLNIIT